MNRLRNQVRRGAALAAGAMAVIYYLIGLGVLSIGGSSSGEMVDLKVFGGGAGTAFLALALLFVLTDRRWVWVLALIFQIWVYVIYVAVSGSREPPFEMWGITLRILQVPVILGLIYLSLRRPAADRSPARGGVR
jgi:hypothetical protein